MEKEVDAGIAHLDEIAPGWIDRVNLERLDMQKYENDVLGQVLGTNTSKSLGSDTQWAHRHGHIIYWVTEKEVPKFFGGTKKVKLSEADAEKNKTDRFRFLTGIWTRKILARRAGNPFIPTAVPVPEPEDDTPSRIRQLRGG